MTVGLYTGIPGENPGLYSALAPGIPGERGQFTDAFIDGRYAIRALDIIDFIPEIGQPCFLWMAGDGQNPTIGTPGAVTGALLTGRATPWNAIGGDLITSDYFDGASYFSSAAADLDPAPGDDLFVIACVRRTPLDDSTGFTFRTIIGNGPGGGANYWQLCINATNNRMGFRVAGAAGITANGTSGEIQRGAWVIAAGIMNDNGNSQVFSGVSSGTSAVTPAGNKFAGLGTFLCADQSLAAARMLIADVRFAAVWKGTGIADVLEANTYLPVRRAIRRIGGIQYGGTPTALGAFVYQRTTHASYKNSRNRHCIIGRSVPRSGDAHGVRSEPAGTSKTYRNINPADGATWTVDDASAVLVIDDSAALATVGADDCTEWGPNVFRYNNATGATRYMRQGPTMGNVNPHSLSILARMVGAGPVAEIGWYQVAGGIWTSVGVITDNYAETRWPDVTPPNANCIFCIKVQNNTEIRWIAHQVEEVRLCNTITPNWATAAGVTRNADYTSTGHDIPDVQCSASVSARSMCWAGTPATAQQLVCGTGGTNLQFVTTGSMRGTDGTNQVDVACVPSETVTLAERYAWKTTGPTQSRLAITGVGEDVDTYDGTQPAGSFQIGRSAMTGGNWRTSRLLVHRNFQTGGGVA